MPVPERDRGKEVSILDADIDALYKELDLIYEEAFSKYSKELHGNKNANAR